jgi:hypothetical protein
VAFWGINTYEVIHAPKTLTGADSRRINNQFCGVIGLSDFETGPFQVMAARPEPLWNSSKGLYLIGGDSRFTGYLLLRHNAEDSPSFEFIILCGRRYYITDQGSPCPLAALNPFGRELLLSDVSTGFKRSTWIQRIL